MEIEALRVTSHPIEDPAVQSMRKEISELRNALKEMVQAVKTIESGPARRRPGTEFAIIGIDGVTSKESARHLPGAMVAHNSDTHAGTAYWRTIIRHQLNLRAMHPMWRSPRYRERSGLSSSSSSALVSQSPRPEVLIAGVSTMCELDTGVEASLISSSFYNEHLKGHGPLDGNGAGVRVVSVTGSILPIIVDRKSTEVGSSL